jgi:hypothetical protein
VSACEERNLSAAFLRNEISLLFRDVLARNHSLTGRDVIVCWRHNWPGSPPQIEILELSSLIKSLSKA